MSMKRLRPELVAEYQDLFAEVILRHKYAVDSEWPQCFLDDWKEEMAVRGHSMLQAVMLGSLLLEDWSHFFGLN